MKATRLYTNENGESAFEDFAISLERAGATQLANVRAPSSMILNETDPGHHYDWHNATQKQWVITFQGEINVELRDGTSRTFGPGNLLLVEDLDGPVHSTTVISKEPWRCAYLPFEGGLGV